MGFLRTPADNGQVAVSVELGHALILLHARPVGPDLHFDPKAEVATPGFRKAQVGDAGANAFSLELAGNDNVAVPAVGDGEYLAGVGVAVGDLPPSVQRIM